MHPKYELSRQYPSKRVFIANATNIVGKALCAALAADGWTIGVSATEETLLAETRGVIENAGGKIISCQGDISIVEQYEIIAKKFIQTAGGIDLLINNTGIDEHSVLGDYSVENWIEIIGRNQMAVIFGCHFFLSHMIQQKVGYVINIAASTNVDPSLMAPYTMARGAVISISETIKSRFFQSNIGVTVALPVFFNQETIAEKILQAAGENIFSFT